MATITSIKLANEENIRSKVEPGSITKNIDADMRDVVANEIRDRGMISVASTAALSAQSKENTRKVCVEDIGIFEALETGDAADNVITFPSADAGWLWKKTLDISTSATPGVTVSSSDSLTLSTSETYVFTGSTDAIWTLPALGTTGKRYLIKNRGTAILTVQRAGSDQLYTNTTATSMNLLSGDAAIFQDDGTYWIVM